MKTFLEQLQEGKEDINYDDLIPAIQYQNKLYKGKRGEGHMDIVRKNKLEGQTNWMKGQHGYFNIKTKKFDNNKDGIYKDVDSPDLMTHVQRFRGYGNEEKQLSFGDFLNEHAYQSKIQI